MIKTSRRREEIMPTKYETKGKKYMDCHVHGNNAVYVYRRKKPRPGYPPWYIKTRIDGNWQTCTGFHFSVHHLFPNIDGWALGYIKCIHGFDYRKTFTGRWRVLLFKTSRDLYENDDGSCTRAYEKFDMAVTHGEWVYELCLRRDGDKIPYGSEVLTSGLSHSMARRKIKEYAAYMQSLAGIDKAGTEIDWRPTEMIPEDYYVQ